MTTALNEELLKGNNCFGCGPENPDGLRIRVFRDEANANRLTGVYRPRESMAGFPQIVHGGLQFTVLDCMAGWAVFVLHAPVKMMPLTRSATTRFLRPARVGGALALSAEVNGTPGPREALLIHTEIRDDAGALLTEVDFDYVLVTQERFMKAAGLAAMPDTYRRHFGEL